MLDFDGHEGLASLEQMDMLHGLPRSLRVRTPSGGVHVYLTCPPDSGITVSVKGMTEWPGVDVRCEGGLVVAPGSEIDGVAYVWI